MTMVHILPPFLCPTLPTIPFTIPGKKFSRAYTICEVIDTVGFFVTSRAPRLGLPQTVERDGRRDFSGCPRC